MGVLDKIEVEAPTVEAAQEETELVPEIPDMSSPKWSEYVLTQFEDDEIIDGNPTTDGLRRVVTKVLGPILESRSKVVQAPNVNNGNHAVVEHKVVVDFGETIRKYTDCADVWHGNTNETFNIYATATAATRAEGRALRKALQLKRVIAAEEVGTGDIGRPDKINNVQINFIGMMCQRYDINVMKLLNMSKKAQYAKIEEVPYATAIQINKYLNDIQNGKKKVPESVVGFDPNWRGE